MRLGQGEYVHSALVLEREQPENWVLELGPGKHLARSAESIGDERAAMDQ